MTGPIGIVVCRQSQRSTLHIHFRVSQSVTQSATATYAATVTDSDSCETARGLFPASYKNEERSIRANG